MKQLILNNHRRAEFYRQLAWHHFHLAKQSVLFKEELLKSAKEASESCRYYRRMAIMLFRENPDAE